MENEEQDNPESTSTPDKNDSMLETLEKLKKELDHKFLILKRPTILIDYSDECDTCGS